MSKVVYRQKKTLKCGCVLEKYDPNGPWYFIQLCNKHKEEYYKNPWKFFRAANGGKMS